jgi:TonB family protein
VGLVLALLLLAVVLQFALGVIFHEVVIAWDKAPLPKTESVIEVSLDEDTPLPESPEEELVKNDRIEAERAPKDTRRVAEFDNDVDKETQAKLQKPVPGKTPTPPTGSPKPSTADAESERDDAREQGDRDARDPDDGDRSATESADLRESDRGSLSSERAAPNAGGGKPSLLGSRNALRDTFGTRGNYERVEGVEEGDENVFDSKRWKYASFFNRVRDAIAEHWDPEAAHAPKDPDGSRYGKSPRVTRLLISLTPDGSLDRISVERSSGLDHLDEEAIRAVRAAAPFPNPPVQLVDASTNTITFSFGFILTFDGESRIFRYKR